MGLDLTVFRRIVLVIFCIFLVQACKHPLAIKGKGDIIERLNGVRGCTYQEFQDQSPRCENLVVEDDYKVSYRAKAQSGWVFVGWEGTACAPESKPPRCEYDVSRQSVDFVNLTWPDTVMPATVAVFKQESEVIMQVAEPVLDTYCLSCHYDGGLSGHTRLVLDNIESPQQDSHNIAAFERFLTEVDDAKELILTKVRGGAAHGGGSLLSSGSEEFNLLSNFLDMLQGNAGSVGGVANSDFWDGITTADSSATLRRAALVLAGRLPKAKESKRAKVGEAKLRETIRGLMKGDAFHDFLIEGANDRLLTDSLWQIGPFDVIDAGADFYPVMARTEHNFFNAEDDEGYGNWRANLSYGFARAPLELIARVAMRDLDYRQILTADYTMANSGSAEILRATQLSFPEQNKSNRDTTFKVARNKGQVVHDDGYVAETFANGSLLVQSHSGFVNYPHAGILTEPAFLARYPTTETNRNRARARWAFQHFLGVDIEKSAGRTTDPAALADTNNPTLNNPNCAVCHQLHDPVAGTFRDFGNEGWYRSAYGGKDALPDNYKYPEEDSSLYTDGDLWFADMRPPGLGDRYAPVQGDSMRWLAKQIVADPRFAIATVQFWWQALMGSEPLEAPEVSTDFNYQARLSAFETQNKDIEVFASKFRQGIRGGKPYNLKDLLVEMAMSNWFRAVGSTLALGDKRAQELQNVGVRRLLTAHELEAKTLALLGLQWLKWDDRWLPRGYSTGLRNGYNIYYGDIDAKGIVVRARELTPLMASVAESQALSSVCALVVTDINKPTDKRKLFPLVERNMTPDSHRTQLKQQLRQWHELLWGEKVGVNSIDVEVSYSLLLELWQARKAEGGDATWAWDKNEDCELPESWWEQSSALQNTQAQDPEDMLGAWSSMLVYFMTDFKFLHE